MSDLKFALDLIKGRIAETIFEQMFRELGRFTLLRFGYEYTMPELAQHQHIVPVKKILEDFRHMPDFLLISDDKKEVYLVEVKYRRSIQPQNILGIAEKLAENWTSPWLFIASPSGFFFEPCHTIVKNEGQIGPLYDKWVPEPIQAAYLELLKEFEKLPPR